MPLPVSYRFTFRPVFGKARESGIFANADVEVWLGDTCLLRSCGWAARNGDKGIWPSPPSSSYESKGQKRYVKHAQLWPKDSGPNSWNELQRFQAEFRKAYEDWKVMDGPPEAHSVPAGPGTSGLPAGWKKVFSPDHGLHYFVTPEGRTLWEDSEEVKKLLSTAVPPPPPRPSLPPPPPRLASSAPRNSEPALDPDFALDFESR